MAEIYPKTSCDLSLADVVSDIDFDREAIADYMRRQGYSDDQIARTHISINDSGSHKRRWESRMGLLPAAEADDSTIHIELLAGTHLSRWLSLKNEEGGSVQSYDTLDQLATGVFSGALKGELNDLGRGGDDPLLSKRVLKNLGLTALHTSGEVDLVEPDSLPEEYQHFEPGNGQSDNALVNIKVARSSDRH